VIPLSDCTGGELCLFEPGIVLDLHHGDAVIFASAAISHFNLHYKGYRASLVFHSDKSGLEWHKDRNGWAHNLFMQTVKTPHIRISFSDDENVGI
jgi:hypothetical protein